MLKPLAATSGPYTAYSEPRSTGAPPAADVRLRAEAGARRISASVVKGSVRLAELILAAGSGLVVHACLGSPPFADDIRSLVALAFAGATAVLAFEALGLYSIPAFAAIFARLPRLALGWTAPFALIVAGTFFLDMGLSRLWLLSWYGTGAAGLVLERIAVAWLVGRWTRQGRLYRLAAIYGGGSITADLVAQLEGDVDSDIRICGIFDDRQDHRVPATIAGYPRLGGLADLVEFGRSVCLDVIVVALPITAEQRLVEMMKHLAVLPADVRLPAHTTRLRFSRRTYSRLGRVAMIDLHDKPISDWGLLAKWVFDKVVALLALLLLSPVLLAVAVAIRLDSPGPVLFRQRRYGFNNELIEVLKFRSMYTDRCDPKASRLVTKDDPRVTRVGRFIRKTSLDELPQLFNVLKGELSLVGPRPHALQAKAADRLYDEIVDGYFARHKVKPGITGWAQINGWRGETDTREKIAKRVEHDLYYIENWSILFDLYILFKTPFALLKTDNAY